jgi:hypothetical protein
VTRYTILAALLLSTPATAQILEPPQRYVHPFHGRLITLYKSPAEMPRFCPQYGIACTTGQHHGTCTIILSNTIPSSPYFAYYLRHEIAHCNGWPANHPQ